MENCHRHSTLKFRVFSNSKHSTFSFLDEEIQILKNKLTKTALKPEYGFYQTLKNESLLQETSSILSTLKNKTYLVHVGIGGSSLGAKVLIESLESSAPIIKKENIYFIDHLDPDSILEVFNNISLSETLFYFVSKSGNTSETLSALNYIETVLLANNIQQETFKERMVVCTNAKEGALLEYAKKHHLSLLYIPENLGGRYSVFSSVGLFTAGLNGIDTFNFIEGAKQCAHAIFNSSTGDELCELSLFLNYLYRKENIDQSVFMPYSNKLNQLTQWFVQLWAESLGKYKSINGSKEHIGLTPIPAKGVTDQHSQLQLFVEGPRNKCVFFIEVEKYQCESNNKDPMHHFEQIINLAKAELFGTMESLKEVNRPYVHFKLPELNAYHLGYLMFFFEALTVAVGEVLEINPFDQPGVESSKKYAKEYLMQL